VSFVATLALAGCQKSNSSSSSGSADLPPGAVAVTSASPSLAVPPSDTPRVDLQGKGALALPTFAPIAKAADPGVVTINTVAEEAQGSGGIFSRGGKRREARGLGTGFLLDKDGTVLTNNHVVEGADSIVVQLSNGHQYTAKVLGRDARTDVAVVRIDAKEPLTPLSLGDSDKVDVGDWVVAIGNPFGLSHTVSAGIVSAKGRGREDVPLDPSGYYNFLQTDASINPGNSGGPLLNLRGEVVGVNTAIRGGGAQGIGFAIPINMVKQLLPPLLRDGKIVRSALGVRIVDARTLLPEDRVQLGYKEDVGAIIEAVEPGGGADKAGLKPGDVIVAFEGQSIERGSLLQWLASTAGVGRAVDVRIIRAGKTFDQKVTLGALPEPKVRVARPPRGRQRPPVDDDDE
jgi:serine protease Do